MTPPRLNKKQKALLSAIRLWKHWYPPVPSDLLGGEEYKIVYGRLVNLEQKGYIEIARKGQRIRAIRVLWMT